MFIVSLTENSAIFPLRSEISDHNEQITELWIEISDHNIQSQNSSASLLFQA